MTLKNISSLKKAPRLTLAFRLLDIKWLRGWVWRISYNYISYKLKLNPVKFLNYGLVWDKDNPQPAPELKPEDEIDRLSIQLYYHLLAKQQLKGKRVLEVGCGRGGGAYFLARYFPSLEITALDKSKVAIDCCKKMYKLSNLQFVEGDAESLPFENAEFDYVLNVESCHCYPNLDKFFSEVSRVLKPNGRLFLTDNREAKRMTQLVDSLHAASLKLIWQKDITDYICQALTLDSDRKHKLIETKTPWLLKGMMKEFSALKGSKLSQAFESRSCLYYSFILQKKD